MEIQKEEQKQIDVEVSKETRVKKNLLSSLVNTKEKKLLLSVAFFAFLFGFLGSIAGLKLYGKFDALKSLIPSQIITQNLKVNESSAVIDAVNKVNPSVVSITSEQSQLDFFGQISQSKSSGTGFIVTRDGLIITNKHVVQDDKASYSVFTSDGKEYKAKIKAKDPLNDIAFLTIDAKNLTPVDIGDSSNLKVGQQVIAIGNALGQYQNTVTTGIVSAIGRAVPVGDENSANSETLENVIQTDAAINPGNSGGPLINLAGQVVGINTAIDSGGQLIGFAIPINMVKNAIVSVQENGKVVRPYIGIRYIPITKEFASRNNLEQTSGVLVYGGRNELAIVPGSPAAKAGLEEGDIVTEIDGKTVDSNHTLIGLLLNYNVGDKVKLTFFRNNKKMTLEVALAESK
ncbi:MAG: trypsin-like peptidase domain-containing protein [Patescibacteria group bacterium]|nr:trypsin-like peptidase domain-containing protein [Patescibacteria group bacterium]MCL5094202.1 trypsin-like peptidase domain-containing protein [Patescibacteria group bacterium]